MTDILERLREQAEYYSDGHGPLHEDAANEIERLRHERRNLQRSWSAERAEVKRLRDALHMIAEECDDSNFDVYAEAQRALDGGQTDANT